MKKMIFVFTMVVMLMTILPVFAQRTIERVYVYTENDSLVVHYSFDPQMEFLLVQDDGTMIGPSEKSCILSGVLYLNKKWTYVHLNDQGAWSKIPMPATGIYDFTWEFSTRGNRKAFSLVDKFSNYSVSGNSRDRNPHFEVEINQQRLPIARGTMRQ